MRQLLMLLCCGLCYYMLLGLRMLPQMGNYLRPKNKSGS